MGPRPKLATFDDLLRQPEDVRAEVIDGAVVVSPPPLPEHGRVQSALAGLIGGPYDINDGRGGPGGWWILTEVDDLSTSRIAPFEAVDLEVARLFFPL